MVKKAIIQVSRHLWLKKIMRLCPDRMYIHLKWIGRRMPYRLNLKHPRTFNEKLQWMKLYDRKPLYTTLVDKYSVKQYVSTMCGEEYVIPVLGVWERVEDIEWEKLPRQFVIKCSHDCGGMVICRDKSKLNKDQAREKIRQCFLKDYYYEGREWPYKNVKKRIFAEQYMEDEYGELRDYKFFCFDGVVKAMFVASERTIGEEVKFDFFDENFIHLDLKQGHPNADAVPNKPQGFETMKKLAAMLSKGIPQVRIDFYDVNGHVFFGEFTFFHFGGMVSFEPIEWDYTFGSWVQLPVS